MLTELVENMKFAVTVDDAFVFVLDPQDGNFYMHQNKEQATCEGVVVSGDSPLVGRLAHELSPLSPRERKTRRT